MNFFRPRTSVFVVLFVASMLGGCSAPRGGSGDRPPVVGSAAHPNPEPSNLRTVEPSNLLSSAIAKIPSVTAGAYPDADEVSLFEWEETRYGTNGTYTTTWTSLSKILTQRGLENNRTFSFSNNDFYGSTTVLVARVHSPDGTARDVDLGANLAEAVDTGSLASNIHDPNDKTFTLAFPELAVGDAVEVSMRRVAKRPRCEGVYADYLTFESDHPILFQGVRITGPASMPLRSRAFRDAGPVSLEHAAFTNEEAGTITEVWTAGETPRYFAEPDMPPAYDCTARLLLSTAPDWESLSRWYAKLCAPHLAATNAAMALKVAELVASATGSATDDPSGDAPAARPPDWETYRILPSDPSAEEEAIYDKIERIVLPAFDVKDATLPEVFSLLTDLSRGHDPDESVPLERRGVEFAVRLDAGSDADVPLVTIKERDVSVEDVLDLVEEQADVKYRVEEGRVAVRRREDATGETFGRMFVPAIPHPAGEHVTPDDWKAYFSTLGVRWPEGSSVELVADGSGVLVRNTFPELDVLASRHGTFDPRRLPTVFVDARGFAPLQLRADGSTVVRPDDRVVPPGAAQDRELVRLLEVPGRTRSPFPPGVEVDAKAPVRALKTVADSIASVGFLPVALFRIAGRPFVQWDNSVSAPEVAIDFDHPDEPVPGFLFFGVEAVEHAWHPFPFSDGAPFPEGRHDRHVDAAGAAKVWRAACEPGKPDPEVVVFCDPDATCGRLHELMVSLQGAGARIGVCVWGGNVFSPVANRLRAENANPVEAGPLREGAAERSEDGGELRAESGIPETGKPDFETACRIEFREMDDEWKLEQLSERWFQLALCRVDEARLREALLSLSETALGPGETLAKARQAVKCAEDAENEEDPLPARVQSLSESERDAFLENVWVERLTEIRRLEEAIGSLKERIQIVCHSWPRDDEFEEEARPRAQREAAIRALFDFVSREVRYMGAMAESEAPGYEPHDVSLTFDNRYGVCRDKAALLVAMLRMAGIDAWPVLINVGPRKDPQVPQPYFNHAIVAADSGDPADPYLLMDPTSETTRSLLPEYLCEMSYLVARDEGEGIRETPPLPVEQNLLRAETVYTLHADASADVTTTLSFAGVNDAAYRGYFASIPRDGLRAFFERVLQGIPGAVLTGWEVRPAPEALRTSPEPLSVRLDYAIAEAARGAEDGRAALLDLPTVPAALAIASRVVGDLGLEKRRFPLVTDYPCGWEETVEIRLPDGVTPTRNPNP